MTKIIVSGWSLQKCIVVDQLDVRNIGRQYRVNKSPSNYIRLKIADNALHALKTLHEIQGFQCSHN